MSFSQMQSLILSVISDKDHSTWDYNLSKMRKLKRVHQGMKQQVNGEKNKGRNSDELKAQHKTDNNTDQTIIVWTYLSGEHKQSDEEDKEGDRAHGLQIFENSWS